MVIGKDVILECNLNNNNNATIDDNKIIWFKMPKGEILTLDKTRVTKDIRFNSNIKCNYLNDNNSNKCLLIEQTNESDNGYYVCQNSNMLSKYIYLDILSN